MKTELLRMRNIDKQLHGERILKNIDLTVYQGEIHGLIGRNGMGKSTLMNLLNGTLKWEKGDLYLRGNKVRITSEKAAMALGIGYVGCENRCVSSLTVSENLFLLNPKSQTLIWKEKDVALKARHYLNRVGLATIDPLGKMSTLSTVQKKYVELARELIKGAQLILLDEFTAAMTTEETRKAWELLRTLNREGITFLIATNKLDEAYALCNRITVLRDGISCYTLRKDEVGKEELIRHLLSGEVTSCRRNRENFTETNLELIHWSAGNRIRDVSLKIHKGEILAVSGSGRKELIQSMFGLVRDYSGKYLIKGELQTKVTPPLMRKKRISFLFQNRGGRELVENMSCRINMTLGVLKRVSTFGVIRGRLETNLTNSWAERIKMQDSLERNAAEYSRGQRQKILFSKSIMGNPEIMLMINPTEGTDEQSAKEIRRVMLEEADKGKTIIFCSDDMETIYQCADRLIVLGSGLIQKEIVLSQRRLEALGELITETY